MAQSRVLLTGFGPFPGAADNVSGRLVEALAATSPSSRLGCELHARVLPTEWAEISALVPTLLNQYKPRLILHLGLSKRIRSFRIERSAHNRVEAKQDACGALPVALTILNQGHARLDTGLPAARLAKHLRTLGLAAVTSSSAGSYLCNFLYYLSLEWAGRQETTSDVCFVHVPPGTGRVGGPFSESKLLRGVEQILRCLLAFAEQQDGERKRRDLQMAAVLLTEKPYHDRPGEPW